LINEGEFAINKGYILSETDQVFKSYILEVACKGSVTFKKEHRDLLLQHTIPRLHMLSEDGLITLNKEGFKVNEAGRQYLRNICQAFDLKWQSPETKVEGNIFSKAV
jgi:oxygen-independent coproporphyrinogen-3 oxidase